MGAILLGILLLVVAALIPLPYPLGIILYIVSAIAIIYGVWVLFFGGPRGPYPTGTRRRVRWY